MKRLIAICAILVTLAGCSGAGPGTPTPATPDAAASAGGMSLVLDVKGHVEVKRDGWTAYAPALLGTVVRNGDLLRLDASSQARVLCGDSGDLRLVSVAKGTSGVPCAVERALLEYGGSQISGTRGDVGPDVPMVLSPRKTKLLSSTPALRWASVPGVESYTISVSGPGGFKWSQAVEGKSEVAYPASAPPLKPGGPYALRVEAGGHNSDEEGTPGRGFTVLADADAQKVRDDQKKIDALANLSDTERGLVMARMFANRGLYADAVERLEALASATQEPAVVRTLGDIYLLVGVNRLAEKWYETARQQSAALNDLEGQGLAEKGLGQAYEALGNADEAAAHWQAAQGIYQKLGDLREVGEIQGNLARLTGK